VLSDGWVAIGDEVAAAGLDASCSEDDDKPSFA